MLTRYGISVITIRALSWPASSTCAAARMLISPRPVLYASVTPAAPYRMPPVGKSGPRMGPASGL